MSPQANPRLAFVTEWFPPEVEGAPLWIAQALRSADFDVGVVTGMPHYPDGVLAKGYRGMDRTLEVVEGFQTLRVPEYPSHDTSAVRRIATYSSFALSSSVLAARTIARGDVTLVYSSPATSALPAMTARSRFGTPYVLLIQDLWPDTIFATGFLKSGALRTVAETVVTAFVDASYRWASHICVISPGMRRTLIERGVPPDKVSVVFNWTDEAIFFPAPRDGALRRALGLGDDAFVALFAGNVGEAQGLKAWVSAMSRVSHLDDVHLVFLGGGTQSKVLRTEAETRGVRAHVHFLDAVAASDVPAFAADADVSIVSLADQALFEITMPSKVQACLAMASPVIASCAGDVAEVVRESGAGWVARPNDSASIAEAIEIAHAAGPEERLRRGQLGRRYYQEHMAREIGSQTLAKVLRLAASERQTR